MISLLFSHSGILLKIVDPKPDLSSIYSPDTLKTTVFDIRRLHSRHCAKQASEANYLPSDVYRAYKSVSFSTEDF